MGNFRLARSLVLVAVVALVGCAGDSGASESDGGSTDSGRDGDSMREPVGDAGEAGVDASDGAGDVEEGGGRDVDGADAVDAADTAVDATDAMDARDVADAREDGSDETDTGGDASGGAAPDRFCTDDDWCWYQPEPHGYTIRDVWVGGPNDIWAVGNGGMVMHGDGTDWRAFETPVSTDLHGVWPDGTGRVWAVGAQGTVLLYEGNDWRLVSSPSGSLIDAIWGVAPDEFWVGGKGDFAKWTGQSWQKVAIGGVNDPQVDVIWGNGADDFWVGGRARGGLIRQWDGQSWKEWGLNDESWDKRNVSDFAEASGELFAVAKNVYKRDASSDEFVNQEVPVDTSEYPSSANLVEAHSDGNELWAVGQNQWSHWDGSSWSAGTTGGAWMIAMHGQGGEVWAGGSGGRLTTWNGSGWDQKSGSTMSPDEFVGAFDGTGPDDVWALASVGRMYHWDGREWTARDLPDEAAGNATGVWANPQGDVWLLLEWQLWRWDGTEFTKSTDIERQFGCSDIWGSASDDVWMSCSDGIRHWDGSSWSQVEPNIGGDVEGLEAVDGAAADDVWMVGEGGRIYRYDGTSWSKVSTPDRADDWWTALDVVGPDDVWIAGSDGKAWHWDGSQWTKPGSIPNGRWIQGVAADGTGNVWVIANELDAGGGYAIRWDGSTWTRVNPGVGTSDLSAVWAADNGGVWAGGDDGSIVGNL